MMARFWRSMLFGVLGSVTLANAVTVVKTTAPEQTTNAGGAGIQSIIVLVIGSLVILGLAFAIAGGLFYVIYKAWKRLSDARRSSHDFLFKRFVMDSNQCHFNRNPHLKRRNWKLFFLFWKRVGVYVRTSQNKYEYLGAYNGECKKKEGFGMVGIYQKLGFFKMIDYIIIIPHTIYRDMVETVTLEGKPALILNNVDGIDEVENTDFYFLPLIKDPKQTGYLDFSDMIHKEYVEKVVLRATIKENLLDFKDSITKAVEMNPNLQHKRKSE